MNLENGSVKESINVSGKSSNIIVDIEKQTAEKNEWTQIKIANLILHGANFS